MLIAVSGCSHGTITSINKDESGNYIMTGTKHTELFFYHKVSGFVWKGKYDSGSNTMVVQEQ
jgi:hypothetical protein